MRHEAVEHDNMLTKHLQTYPEQATYHGSSFRKHGASTARSNGKYVHALHSHYYIDESTEVQTLGAVYTYDTPPCHAYTLRMDVTCYYSRA